MVKPINLVGTVYGMLTVREQGDSDTGGKAQWWCECTCGRRKLVRAQHLKQESIRSCGECGATHHTGIDHTAIRYEMTVWSGARVTGKVKPNYGPWSWGQVVDATTKELVFRSTTPQHRSLTPGEIHPCVTRCMRALVSLGLIEPDNMRTAKRWCVEERVTVDVRNVGDDSAVTDAWHEVTGEPRPPVVTSRQQKDIVIGTPTAPEQWAEEEKMIRQVFGLDNDPSV